MYSISHLKQEASYVDNGLTTVQACLRKYAEVIGDREAIVFASFSGNREAVTFAEILQKSVTVAKSLIHLGVKPGDVVAVNLRCCPEWLYIVIGTMLAGGCVASISFTYKDGSDFIAIMEMIGNCSMLVMDPGEDGANWSIVRSLLDDYTTDGTAASAKIPSLKYIIGCEKGEGRYLDGIKSLEDLINASNPDIELPEVNEDSLAILLQTSGSTGVPKLIALSHSNMMFANHCSTGVGGYLDQSNTQFNDRPFTWLGGFPWSLICGQKRVTINGFDPVPEDRIAGIMKIVTDEKCNMMMALPPLIHALIERKDDLPKDWPVQALLTGGQPMIQSVAEAIGTVANSIVTSYGGSEFSGLAVGVCIDKGAFKEFYCGKLIEGPRIEVKVVDDNEGIVPVNTRGEFYIRSEGIFQEYYNDPVRTATAKTNDGWYRTDDIGMITENGDIYVYGRKSNMIISGGMNVAPDILENSISKCPGVAEVVVVPIPDDVYYQVLCACLIRVNGSDVTEQQVRDYCDDIHNDKPGLFTVLPRYYIFVDSFPETGTGKVSRPLLTEFAKDVCMNQST